jgi:nucleoside-diphosphate-sugar epimerase
MGSEHTGVLDLCTDVMTSLNEASVYFNTTVKYIDERPGDVKTIQQDPGPAWQLLGWKAKIDVREGIQKILQ